MCTSTLVEVQVLWEGQKLSGVGEDFVRIRALSVSKHSVPWSERTAKRDGRVLRDDASKLRTQNEWEYRFTLMFSLRLQDLEKETSSIAGSLYKSGVGRLAHIIEIHSCAVNVHQNLVGDWLGFRRILCEFNFGWVVELVDYEGTHSEGRGRAEGFPVKLCSHPDQNGHVSSVCAEALIMIAGETLLDRMPDPAGKNTV